jgi:aminopeptidase N
VSLTLTEARARAAQLSDVSYEVAIDLTDETWFGSRVTVRFSSTGEETFLELHRGEARLPYVTDGDGMHTFTDPADGERYVGAYVGIDITQRSSPASTRSTSRPRSPSPWRPTRPGRCCPTPNQP